MFQQFFKILFSRSHAFEIEEIPMLIDIRNTDTYITDSFADLIGYIF